METENKELKNLLTAKEVSNRWDINLSSVYRMAREGDLPCKNLTTGRIRFDPEELNDLLNQEEK